MDVCGVCIVYLGIISGIFFILSLFFFFFWGGGGGAPSKMMLTTKQFLRTLQQAIRLSFIVISQVLVIL